MESHVTDGKDTAPVKSIEELYFDMIEVVEEEPKNKIPEEIYCCLMEDGMKCGRLAGNASYSKRVKKDVDERDLSLSLDPEAKYEYICDSHKDVIQSVRLKRKYHPMNAKTVVVTSATATAAPTPNVGITTKKPTTTKKSPKKLPSVNNLTATTTNSVTEPLIPQVDFSKLQLGALRRYKRGFKLKVPPNANKAQLVEAVQNHFKTIEIDEMEMLALFMYSVKTKSNRLDYPQNPGDNNA